MPHAGERSSDETGRRIGKVVVLIVAGATAGYFYHADSAARRLQAASLPAEIDRTACPFDPRPAGANWPLFGDVLLMCFMFFALFGAYELAGRVVGRAIGLFLPRAKGAAAR